jgi:uncharacterized membrane protein
MLPQDSAFRPSLEHAVPAKQIWKASDARSVARLEVTAWVALTLYLAVVVGFAWNPTPVAQGLAAIGIAIACAHAALAYGWKDALVFLVICLVTTFAMENIGVATGVPFGKYHFEVGRTCRMSE